jgi:hypothetical protein
MPDGEDKLIAVAMHIVVVAPMVGTEPLALAEAIGFPIQNVGTRCSQNARSWTLDWQPS